jgi:hypothetical protein
MYIEPSDLCMATDPYTPQDVLDKLANHADLKIRKEVARNKSTWSDTLARLAKDEEIYVVCAVAWNPSISYETLLELVQHPNEDVRYWATINDNCTYDIRLWVDTFGWNHSTRSSTPLVEFINAMQETPEAVKLWLKSDGFAGMTLAEFITATQETP